MQDGIAVEGRGRIESYASIEKVNNAKVTRNHPKLER